MSKLLDELEYLRAQCHTVRQFKAELLIKNRIELIKMEKAEKKKERKKS